MTVNDANVLEASHSEVVKLAHTGMHSHQLTISYSKYLSNALINFHCVSKGQTL